jgi:hypothetical protein
MSGPCGQQIRARTIDRHLPSIESASAQLVAKKVSNRALVRSDRFDVD